MKTITHHIKLAIAMGAMLASALPLLGQTPVGQWDFNSSNLVATIGTDLTYANDGGVTQQGTRFGTTASFGIPDINGTNAVVMQFPAATNGGGYMMTAPPNPNGAGTAVNVWTLIMDLLYPSSSDKMIRPIIDTDGTFFVPGPDFVIDSSDGIGSPPSGPYDGMIVPNTWYRVGIVVTNTEIRYFLNGLPVGEVPNVACPSHFLDCRYALTPSLPTLILGSTDTNAALGYVNSIQLWGVNLDAGQMKALGGASGAGIPTNIPPVPSYIESQTPGVSVAGVPPNPPIEVLLNQGSTTVNAASIQLLFDDVPYPINVNATLPTFDITAILTNLLDPSSVHSITLLWSDSVVGANTNAWSFTVAPYQSITLPAPFYLETFDQVAEGGLPVGWVATNATTVEGTNFDLCIPTSAAYENWLVINTNRLCGYTGSPCPGFECDTLAQPPVVVNGVLLDSLTHSNFLYFESDNRCDKCYGQIGVLFSPDIDCTGRTNVFVSWHSLYKQNQDNIAALEYSIDQGVSWLPVIYYLDDQSPDVGGDPDVIYTNGVVDVGATFNTARGDQPANGTNYGWFICAPISSALIPYVAGRTNDDSVSAKMIETVRLSEADGQAHVRFRFVYAGTCSWFWGVDDFGLYEINTPVITTQPATQSADAGTSLTLSVVASSPSPLTFQWELNGHKLTGETNSTYTIPVVTTNNAGQYQVIVGNSSGITKSTLAVLTVITTPMVSIQPISLVSDPGGSATLTAVYRGGRPIGSVWYQDGAVVAGSSTTGLTNTLTIGGLQTNNSANYLVVITNIYGATTSTVGQIIVYVGPITNNLVAHLTFDGNFTDSSGRGNNAAYAYNGTNADTTPTFAAGKIGQAFEFTTWTNGSKIDYATFGYPDDLKFGDANPFSVSFWINYTNQSDDLPFISNKDWNSSGNQGWGIFPQSPGDFRVNVTSTNGGTDKFDIHPTTILREGNWHNVVLSFVRSPGSSASYVNTYADGVMVNQKVVFTAGPIDTFALPFTNEQGPGPTNPPLPTIQTNWAVNVGQDGTGVYHDQGSAYNIGAKIDDLGIWRRALTANEVAGIYAAGLAGKDLSQAVAATAVPPSISQSPISQVISPGANVSFTVTAGGGTPPLTYAWEKDQHTIGGATSSTLTLNGVTTNDAGAYLAIISNSGGSVTSKVAQLTVFTGSITQDLVAHLKFDGDYKDSSGAGTDGTANGTPTFEAGIIGQAVHLHSAGSPAGNPSPNNYVTLGYPAQLKFGTSDFSISFWAKVLSQNDDKPFISNKDWNSGGNPGWALATEGDGMKWNFKDSNSSRRDSLDVASQLENGQWHHVLVSFQRSSVGRIYVDGQLMDTSNLSPDPGQVVGSADTALAVNVGQDGTGLYTDGTSGAEVEMLVDDLGIWGRVVTPQEATAVYVTGQSGKDLSQAVVGAVSPPTISVEKQGNSWVIIYTGTLYSSSTVNGTYTLVSGASSPYTIPTGPAAIQFYRAHQ
jgi:hypothetical protein